ncbi:MAG: N-6 DNA methylase [Candidatus Edwardsbacteria bacterium]|nr:N-6 DNA methylase [Candidatus Edwardsbacteria bacterium]
MPHLKTALQELVTQAKANKIHHLSEMQVQSDYVLKILEALGWKSSDWKLGSGQGVNTGTFPDIRLHNRNKHTVMIVECKDARRTDKLDGRYQNKTFEQQLYGYCQKDGIYWGILTNFVEWRLYNSTLSRLYENKKYAFIDLLWSGANPKEYVDLLSDEGLAFLSKFQRTPLCQANGKVDDNPVYYPLEKRIEEIKNKFFLQLKGWRDSLRRELHKNYGEKYQKDEIDLFTQKILDRMIFMEVCHDKGIIGQDIHRAILSSRDDKYHELKKRFRDMDEHFNTELFAPLPIDHFDIDDKVMVPIITELNGIDFSDISVHIIGEVYENYLGEMLRVTKKSGLKMQEHKEQAKRKSQGIYYTPEYIVDYIVKNTVGELVKKARTDDDLKRIKILDPACGSGSFLIKAFDVMYDAYEKLKIDKSKGQLETRKDLKIKRAILQHNLYGVDLDERAVEITKLNLMLKALEGFDFHELKGRKLLPNLNLNIRVGNSLISGQTIEQFAEKEAQTTIPGLDDVVDIKPLLKLHNEFYKAVEDEQKERLIKEIEIEERRLNRKLGDNLKGYFTNLDEIKPLNYQVAFPEVYKQGGFDAVIGNPPYGAKFDSSEKQYLFNNYTTLKGQPESYEYFIARMLNLLAKDGYGSYITPTNFIESERAEGLRNALLNDSHILVLSNFRYNVWKDNAAETLVIVIQKACKKGKTLIVHPENIHEFISNTNFQAIKQDEWLKIPKKRFLIRADLSLINKIEMGTKSLGNICDVSQGIIVYKTREEGEKNLYIANTAENDKWVKLLDTHSTVQRYNISWGHKYLKYGTWLWCPRESKYFTEPKILFVRLRNKSLDRKLIGTLDKEQYYNRDNFNNIILIDDKYSLEYILGLFNSRLINYWYKSYFDNVNINPAQVRLIPIKVFDAKKNKTIKVKIIRLVKEMLKLNKTPELRQRHSADIAVIDQEIDELVYRLYGLSEAEKKVVAG